MADRPPWKRWITRHIGHPSETAALHVVHFVFRALPLDAASALGGAVARWIGPHLRVSRRARRNLARVFPEMDKAAIEAVVREMWDNLGRVAAELPHLPRIRVFAGDAGRGPQRVEMVGLEHLDAARDGDKPVIFFTAHIGNWEIGPLVSSRRGLKLHVVYRSANNPWADRLFLGGRREVVSGLIPKGAEGARQALKALQNGEPLGMLVDQKMNDGIAVPFLGRTAMTAPALAQLALRFDCVVLPAWVERLGGAYYRLTIEPPLELVRTGDRHANIRDTMERVNARMEAWIRACPGQWLWLHRRWPD
jgi:KDO2-lipid IV(A) lauroyltransferase